MNVQTLNCRALLTLAYAKAAESPNPSTQNSALLVNTEGKVMVAAFNSFIDRVQLSPERLEKPLRYKFSVHAERNVIYKAAEMGVATQGLVMVSPWAPCADCAQAIVQSGCSGLITHKQALDRSGSWQAEVDLGLTILHEAGIEVLIFDGELGCTKIRRDGQVWQP